MRRSFFLLFFISALFSCNREQKKLFRLLDSDKTGLKFSNTLFLNDSLNGATFEYIFNGAGVAIGDVNNDGLKDIFVTGNMVSSRLYLNQGNLKFKDITTISGTETDRWCTGTTFVDINDDGLLDLYICVAGEGKISDRKNIFFINKGLDAAGVPHFIDQASAMKLDDDGYSTMGVFLDYDHDQDLDLYVLTNAMEGSRRNALRPIFKNGEAPSTDRLYRNNGDGTFSNVSRQAGILVEGYGLGVGLCDINQDGWTDIYCANDFLSNDLLWINNHDGTFTDKAAEYFKHFTHSGMGMDIADYNNDGLTDVIVLDMMPYTNMRQKLMIGYKNFNKFYESLKLGYHPQFMRNTLQLNRGKFPDGQFRFSEVGYLAGVYQTDWSWAPVMADLDNDGWKDLVITNGFRKDVTNMDYIMNSIMDNTPFGTDEVKKTRKIKAMEMLKDVKLPNFVFRNERNLTFSEQSKEWGLQDATFSNGMAVADLDNDGDLDLLMNNIDQELSLYENLLITGTQKRINTHFLTVRFDRSVRDVEKIGLKIWIYQDSISQYYEYYPCRGYKSCIDPDIHIGLGKSANIDSMVFRWPQGEMGKIVSCPADTTLIIYKSAPYIYKTQQSPVDLNLTNPQFRFREITKDAGLVFKHIETSPNDMDLTPTLIHSLNRYGPGLAVGDINKDGLDDLYAGNDSGNKGRIFIQNKSGFFVQQQFRSDSLSDDMGALFFDADNDGDEDLIILKSGNQKKVSDLNQKHLLYFNDGSGNFSLKEGVLPEIRISGSCVTACDYDRDGDLDLFLAGRVIPGKYPAAPQSYLLENEGGFFKDVSEKLGDKNGKIGMISSALWTDVNNDNKPDLVLVGEWMPVSILINKDSAFADETEAYGLDKLTGWWNSINGADLDNDGDMDYVIGNYGTNSFFKTTSGTPVEIFAKDFDNNGTIDPVITHYIGNKSFIVHPRDVLIRQIPAMSGRFDTYEKYGGSTFQQSFTKEEISGSIHMTCNTLKSIILENVNGHRFIIHELPAEAQFSPVYGIAFEDFNNDDLKDIILVGNSYSEETITGYYDASYGLVLINKGNMKWEVPEINKINLICDGDKKALVKLFINNKPVFLISENNGFLKALSYDPVRKSKPVQFEQNDWYYFLNTPGGKRKEELYYGSGFLSGSSRKSLINDSINHIDIYNYMGESRRKLLR
jgi:hypothetical protein